VDGARAVGRVKDIDQELMDGLQVEPDEKPWYG
jgi:hypothetical protein